MTKSNKQNGKDLVPLSNGANGEGNRVVERDAMGRFSQGNQGGPGNPYAKKISELRSALMQAVTPDDLQEVIAKLVEEAKGGNIPAAKELLDRVLGRALEVDLLDRLDAVEQVMIKMVEERKWRA